MEEYQNTKREIVRCEYFSGVSEPAITFKRCVVKFSAVCLKQISESNYVLFVIDRAEKKLIIEPCDPDERDAIRWNVRSLERRKPKEITCPEFCRRLFGLMRWDGDCRYKLFGKATCGVDEKIVLAFDLTSAIIYRPDDSGSVSRNPDYPDEWGNGFGHSIHHRIDNPLVRRFTKDMDLTPIQEISENGNKEQEHEKLV